MRRATVREDTRIGGSEPIYNRPSNASSGVPVDRRGTPMGYASEEIEGMRNTGLFIGQTPRGYHGSVGHLAVPSELYYLRHGGKKAHEPTIKGGKLKKNPKKGSKIRGGDITDIDPIEMKVLYYSKLEPNGYNPKLGQQHWQVGGNDYNQPYLQWIKKHPWMTPFGEVAEEYGQRLSQAIENREDQLQKLKGRLTSATGKDADLWKQFNVAADKAKAFANSTPSIQAVVETQTLPGYKGVIDPATKQYLDLYSQAEAIWDAWHSSDDPVAIKRQADNLELSINNLKRHKGFYLDDADQREFLRGYDEIQQSFNRWTHEVWRKSLDPDQWEADSPYNLGKIWASMYNRSWQPQIDYRSTGEMVWDQFKDNFNLFKDIGTTIAEVAA
jgi:hypothetical protein